MPVATTLKYHCEARQEMESSSRVNYKRLYHVIRYELVVRPYPFSRGLRSARARSGDGAATVSARGNLRRLSPSPCERHMVSERRAADYVVFRYCFAVTGPFRYTGTTRGRLRPGQVARRELPQVQGLVAPPIPLGLRRPRAEEALLLRAQRAPHVTLACDETFGFHLDEVSQHVALGGAAQHRVQLRIEPVHERVGVAR